MVSRVKLPRRIPALMLGLTVAPLAVLLWLGWHLVQQDALLEREQVSQRVEHAADAIASALQRSIASSFESGRAAGTPGAARVVLRRDSVQVEPRDAVRYLPLAPPLPEASPATFARGEDLEFRQKNPIAAAAIFQELASSDDAAVRAGALVRLARCLRKAGRTADADAAYRRASDADDVAVEAMPASLAAIYGRGTLLEAQKNVEALHALGLQLERDLAGGRWALTGPTFLLYTTDAQRWSGHPARDGGTADVLAGALTGLWRRHFGSGPEPSGSGQESLDVGGEPVAVVWRASDGAVRALIASRSFVKACWLPAAEQIAHEQHVRFALTDRQSRPLFGASGQLDVPVAVRRGFDAALPWTVLVASEERLPEAHAFELRRRWLIAGFVLLAVMGAAASYAIVHAVNRELAVAHMQSDFVADVSHEFRTPLTALRQFTDMLRERSSLGDEQRRTAYEAQSRATDRLTSLVEALLEFGRLEAGARRYRLEPRECSSFVRQIVDDFAAGPKGCDRSIRFDGDENLPVECDEEALTWAIRNLLDNAVKYSPDGGPVVVSVAQRDEEVRILVKDSGIGIPRNELGDIFKKFYRGEEARSRGIGGTGIGLAMVYEIARAHRGRVDVTSAPGEGSTFTVVLPLARRVSGDA